MDYIDFDKATYDEWVKKYLAKCGYHQIGETMLRADWLPGGKYIRGVEDFRVLLPAYGWVTIPAGFVSDFASIPRLFWRIAPKNGPWAECAYVHDFLCRHHPMSREEADRIFVLLMERAGVKWIYRKTLYGGVRVGAFLPFIKAGLPGD